MPSSQTIRTLAARAAVPFALALLIAFLVAAVLMESAPTLAAEPAVVAGPAQAPAPATAPTRALAPPPAVDGGTDAAAEVEIERMTWIEVRDAVAAGKTTVIIPAGGTEQNGRHMIIGKHNLIVAEAARRTARALGDALVAPVLAYVPEGDPAKREGNMAFPGTVSVAPEVYAAVLESAAASFKAHGLRTIVLMGDHGQTQAPQALVADKLSKAWAADGVRVLNAHNYYANNGGAAWLAAQGESRAAFGSHAGIEDTAQLMAVHPAGVRFAGFKPDSDGASGDASRATAARGEKLLQLKVDAAVAEIKAAKASAPRAAAAPEPGVLARLLRLITG